LGSKTAWASGAHGVQSYIVLVQKCAQKGRTKKYAISFGVLIMSKLKIENCNLN
jgi:hypothetical protein